MAASHSPVPRCEGPGAPSLWLGGSIGTGATRPREFYTCRWSRIMLAVVGMVRVLKAKGAPPARSGLAESRDEGAREQKTRADVSHPGRSPYYCVGDRPSAGNTVMVIVFEGSSITLSSDGGLGICNWCRTFTV